MLRTKETIWDVITAILIGLITVTIQLMLASTAAATRSALRAIVKTSVATALAIQIKERTVTRAGLTADALIMRNAMGAPARPIAATEDARVMRTA